jgi:hypothetical protein
MSITAESGSTAGAEVRRIITEGVGNKRLNITKGVQAASNTYSD